MITTAEYTNLDEAYDYFSAELFDGRLPAVLITFQRKQNSMGYFSPRRFKSRHSDEHTDELALNPIYFGAPDMEILQTLVHEMSHVWQQHFGKPSRGGYHNKEWAAKMMAIGLMPSDTHAPGGKTTGQNMGDYVIAGGPFERSAEALLGRGFSVQWVSRERAEASPAPGAEGEEGGEAGEGKPKPKSKIKYTCPGCKANAWGKPDLALLCGACSTPEALVGMEAQE